MPKKQGKRKRQTRKYFAARVGERVASLSSSATSAKRSRARAPESVASNNGKLDIGASLFESQWSRKKFEILGRKRKNEGRRVGLSRSAAIDKRKKTILQEFKNRGKVNVFLDRRFGEKDGGLGEEEKAILRLQREKQAQWQKKSKFTLPDEDEEAILTHGGTALSELDDFEDHQLEEDGEDEELEELVENCHFGIESPNGRTQIRDDQGEKRSKSKKEIMEEIIAKSKFNKAQKAKEKEEDAELKNQLDKEFAALTQSQAILSLVCSKMSRSPKSTMDQADDFDKLLKEMGMDMRAHASDRLKTEEEVAKEERARLEELEELQKKRMLNEEVSEDSGSEEMIARKHSKMNKRCRVEPSGDDLGENFSIDNDHSEKGWVYDVLARREERGKDTLGDGKKGVSFMNENEQKGNRFGSDSASEEESEDTESESNAWGESDEETLGDGKKGGPFMIENEQKRNRSGSDSASEEESEGADSESNAWGESDDETFGVRGKVNLGLLGADGVPKVVAQVDTATNELKPSYSISELPFVIEAPKSLKEFKCLVEGRPITDILTIIQRIRTCNSIHLAAENRRKMQIFFGVLLQYFACVAGGRMPTLEILNALVKPLIEMSAETPYFSAVCSRAWIVHIRGQFIEKLKNSGADECWPSCKTLALFRLWTLIFPPSDFRHVVLTPCSLLMAEYLTRAPVKSTRDLTLGVFLCGLLLSIMRPARRFCPEALCFAYAALTSSLPVKLSSSRATAVLGCGSFMLELVCSKPWLRLQNDCSPLKQIESLEFNDVMVLDKNSPFFDLDTYRLSILSCLLKTLAGFSNIYEDISCYQEIFDPFVIVLQGLSLSRLFPQAVKTLISELLGQMKDIISKNERLRQPLRMRVKKPVPIKQFNPKFEENFVRGRNYDPVKERAEVKRLQRLVKEEAKGAARELRKDNYFLLAEKVKEKALAEEHRKEKYSKTIAFLQEQEAAFKSGQLGKGRGSRKR